MSTQEEMQDIEKNPLPEQNIALRKALKEVL